MCTRVLWSDSSLAVIVGRTMDWIEDMGSNLWVFPRGMARDGLAQTNTLSWTSKFGSLTTTAYDLSVVDGVNEQGLCAHVLWLAESDYGLRDEQLPGLSVGLWCQFLLDSFANVAEAVAYMQSTPFQILPIYHPGTGRWVTVHMAIEDAGGDSAIIEYDAGKPRIYHGRDYVVMTNSPPYHQQLENVTQYEGLGGSMPLPGDTSSDARFVRATYYLKRLPKPTNQRLAVAEMLSVMRNVSQPYGVADPDLPNMSPTRFRTVSDLTNGVYFYESTVSPAIVWARLADFDFSEAEPVMKTDLAANPDLIGNIADHFVPAEPFVSIPPSYDAPTAQ